MRISRAGLWRLARFYAAERRWVCLLRGHRWRPERGPFANPALRVCERCSRVKLVPLPTYLNCRAPDCAAAVIPGERTSCVCCGHSFCEEHVTRRAWYDGGAVMVCAECLTIDADKPLEAP